MGGAMRIAGDVLFYGVLALIAVFLATSWLIVFSEGMDGLL
jgi:hypothetical protein